MSFVLLYRCDKSRGDFDYPCFPIIGSTNRTKCVRLVRSFAACQNQQLPRKVRNNVNSVTSYLDGSMIYGSEERIARKVRSSRGGNLVYPVSLLVFSLKNQFPDEL